MRKKRRGLKVSVEPSVPQVSTVPPGGQMESLGGKVGLELSVEPSVPSVSTVSPGGQMESL